MKKIFALLAFTFVASAASANGYHDPYRNHGGHNRGIRPAEALILGGIGAIVINEAYRQRQPHVIIQPQPIYSYNQGYTGNICSNQTMYQGIYNPGAAVAFCQGQLLRAREEQQRLEIEAYQRGASGQ